MAPQLFSETEVHSLLAFVRDTNSFRHIDGKVQSNIEVFIKLAKLMNERYPDAIPKTGEQVRTKWKALKSFYLKEKHQASNSGAGASTWMFFTDMDNTFGHRPCANNVSEDLAEQEIEDLEAIETTDAAGSPDGEYDESERPVSHQSATPSDVTSSCGATTSTPSRSTANPPSAGSSIATISRPATPASSATTASSATATSSAAASTSRSASTLPSRKRKNGEGDLQALFDRMERSRRQENQLMMESFANSQQQFTTGITTMFSSFMDAMIGQGNRTGPASYPTPTTSQTFQTPHSNRPQPSPQPSNHSQFPVRQQALFSERVPAAPRSQSQFPVM